MLVLVVSCLACGALAGLIRPDLAGYEVTFATPGEALAGLGWFAAGAVGTPILVVLVHEAVHGAAFWFFTRSRPGFGFTGWYAYATAPGWHFSRAQLAVVALAPLVTISAVSLAAAWVAPVPVAALLLWAAATNAAGAVGDLYLSLRVLGLPAAALVEDRHDRIVWYLPVAGS